MDATSRAQRMMEEYADDQAQRSGLPEPQRSEARMELHSHVYEAARERAVEDGAEEIRVGHVRSAIDEIDVAGDDASPVFARRRAELRRGSSGKRAVAYAIDFVILMIAVNIVLGPLFVVGSAPWPGGGAADCDFTPIGVDCDAAHVADWIVGPWMAAAWLTYTGVAVLAFAAFERTTGQTPGKMVMDLRALADDGGPLDWTSAVGRNLVKAFPVLALLDAVVGYLVDAEARQRVSDRVAGTIVVEEAS